jgi:hypothetical protein
MTAEEATVAAMIAGEVDSYPMVDGGFGLRACGEWRGRESRICFGFWIFA